MLSRARRLHFGGVLLLVAIIAVGCSSQEGEPASDESHADATHGGDSVAQSELMLVLASADAADGSEDHVVAKCAGCKLKMDGSADYALTVEGYEMHFCGDDCKSKFSHDTEKAVMALKE